MPALVAFGRRWRLGSDDFVLPGMIDIVIKFGWWTAAGIILLQESGETCDELRIYVLGVFAILGFIILTDVMVVCLSMQGGIMSPRKKINFYIYTRLVFEVIDIGWNMFGSGVAYGGINSFFCSHPSKEIIFARRFTVCNWFSILLLILLFIYFWDPLGSSSLDFLNLAQYEKFDSSGLPDPVNGKYWEKTCKSFTCFPSFSSKDKKSDLVKNGFSEVGRIFGYLFRAEDFVPTDVIAGLFALHVLNEEKREAEEKNIKLEEIVLHQPSVQSPEDVEEFHHYLKYIQGCYGWGGYILNSFPLKPLWKTSSCCYSCRDGNEEVEGDNCCLLSTSALKQLLSPVVAQDDFLFITFKNSAYSPTFYVAFDHERMNIVVVIRGTFSCPDILTDLTGIPTQMNIQGLPQSFMAHHGMLLAAQRVKQKLDEHSLLEKAGGIHPNYSMLLLGQSLGAAAAIILGMILRPKYPNLRVIAFSPPGGMLNREAAEYCNSFVKSVVYGDDIIARTSIPSLHIFKKEIIGAIKKCSSPKYQILLSGTRGMFGGKKPSFSFSHDLKEESNAMDLPIHDERRESENMAMLPMFLPGKILHITENKTRREEQRRFEMRWAKKEEFLKIEVSYRMYPDHWHYRMQKALNEFMELNPQATCQTFVQLPL